jgi:hypothetical protein
MTGFCAFLQLTIFTNFQFRQAALPPPRRRRHHGRNFHRPGPPQDDDGLVRSRKSFRRRIPEPEVETKTGSPRDQPLQVLRYSKFRLPVKVHKKNIKTFFVQLGFYLNRAADYNVQRLSEMTLTCFNSIYFGHRN